MQAPGAKLSLLFSAAIFLRARRKDFVNFYFQILSEKLETVVGKICAKKILSFLSEWRPLLDADLEGGPEDLHTALERFIGSRAKRIEEKAWLKISEKLGLGSSFF